jgi:hypothetical protein
MFLVVLDAMSIHCGGIWERALEIFWQKSARNYAE